MRHYPTNFKLGARLLLTAALGALLGGCACCPSSGKEGEGAADEPLGFLLRTNYHGWTDSLWLSNGKVEAIIVPAVARVMQFRFAGEEDGPFWENDSLSGKAPDPQAKEWLNFGGDKAWPAPQAAWGDLTPTNWPPPAGFDSTPVRAGARGWVVALVSPVDPYYGIRTYRRIELDVEQPVMTITTTFEKVSGKPLQVGVWVLTQLKDPIAVHAPVAYASQFREGFTLLSDRRPPSLAVRRGVLSLTRDPAAGHKVGLDAADLLWVGEREMLRIGSSRLIDQTYPDGGCSIEIFTSPNPSPYVEFETLGPLKRMKVGDTISRTSTYTLLRRTELDPTLDMRKLLKP